MKTKTKSPSYLTSAKTMYAALTILKKNGGSMPIRVLMREIEKTVDLTDWEKEVLESTANIRWQSNMHFTSVDYARSNRAIIFYASGAVGHAAVADGGKMNGASARCFLCIAAENAAVADAGIEQVVVDENQVAYLRPPPDIGEQCAAAASGYAIAVADDMALTMEGGVLDVVVATRDGEILVVKVDVALQIHVARTAV